MGQTEPGQSGPLSSDTLASASHFIESQSKAGEESGGVGKERRQLAALWSPDNPDSSSIASLYSWGN